MKKIINNKVYNTETARVVCSTKTPGIAASDFSYQEHKLLQKKTGEYFSCDGEYRIGEGWREVITPLSLDTAKQWVEVYAESEYESVFGVSESDEECIMNVRLSKKARSILEQMRAEKDMNFSEIIEDLIISNQ